LRRLLTCKFVILLHVTGVEDESLNVFAISLN